VDALVVGTTTVAGLVFTELGVARGLKLSQSSTEFGARGWFSPEKLVFCPIEFVLNELSNGLLVGAPLILLSKVFGSTVPPPRAVPVKGVEETLPRDVAGEDVAGFPKAGEDVIGFPKLVAGEDVKPEPPKGSKSNPVLPKVFALLFEDVEVTLTDGGI